MPLTTQGIQTGLIDQPRDSDNYQWTIIWTDISWTKFPDIVVYINMIKDLQWEGIWTLIYKSCQNPVSYGGGSSLGIYTRENIQDKIVRIMWATVGGGGSVDINRSIYKLCQNPVSYGGGTHWEYTQGRIYNCQNHVSYSGGRLTGNIQVIRIPWAIVGGGHWGYTQTGDVYMFSVFMYYFNLNPLQLTFYLRTLYNSIDIIKLFYLKFYWSCYFSVQIMYTGILFAM